MGKKTPEWKKFEIAVSTFLAALDPNAKVIHNTRTLDKQTNTPRQRDVVIETRVCNFIDIKILVSCKRYKKPLDQSHIDAFWGEFTNSNANQGIMYSYSGFTKNAIEKAKGLNIICCKLYEHEPPDIPGVLILAGSYFCKPQCSINILDLNEEIKSLKWNEIFKININDEETLLDFIVETFEKNENDISIKKLKNIFPDNWSKAFTLKNDDGEILFTIQINEKWKFYKGKIEAHLINGTYVFNQQKFIGTQFSPSIDIKNNTPGKDWQEVPRENLEIKGPITTNMILSGGDIRQALINGLGDKYIRKKKSL